MIYLQFTSSHLLIEEVCWDSKITNSNHNKDPKANNEKDKSQKVEACRCVFFVDVFAIER
jgi:hypothetical protein